MRFSTILLNILAAFTNALSGRTEMAMGSQRDNQSYAGQLDGPLLSPLGLDVAAGGVNREHTIIGSEATFQDAIDGPQNVGYCTEGGTRERGS